MKKKPRLTPSAVAKKIAANLRRLGVHGSFVIEKFNTANTDYSGDSADFHWLATALPNWIEWRARFKARYTQDIADLQKIANAFLKPLLKGGYKGRSIAMVETVIGDADEAPDEHLLEWRSLTKTHKVHTTIAQIEGAVERWEARPNYIAARGFAVRVEIS